MVSGLKLLVLTLRSLPDSTERASRTGTIGPAVGVCDKGRRIKRLFDTVRESAAVADATGLKPKQNEPKR